MKKLFATILTLCMLFPLGGCAGSGTFPNRAEREISTQLIYAFPEADRLLVDDVLAYDPERYTYYVELSCGRVLALAPGRIKPASRCSGQTLRCDAEKINRELERQRGAE